MVIAIRRGERNLAAVLVGSYTLALFGLYLLKPARDSLFLSEQSASDLPVAFMLTAVLAVPVSLIYGRAGRLWSAARLMAVVSLAVVLGQLLWWWALAGSSEALSYLFYAWTGIVGGLVSSQFWLLGNTICDTRQAKRLFPLLGLGGIVGAIVGGTVTGRFAGALGLGPRDLVLVTTVVWAVALAVASLAVRRIEPADGSGPAESGGGTSPGRRFMKDVAGSRHLLLIIGIVASSMLVSTFADYIFKSVASAAYPDADDLLGFLGLFYAGMNLASLLLQVMLTSRLVRGLGVGGALMVLPLMLTLGAGALLVAPGLLTASLLRGGEMGLKYSLDKTSRELLYLPLPLRLKRGVKMFVDTFVERGSRGLAGLLLLLATAVLHFSLSQITLVMMVLLVIWLVLTVAMRRQYIQSFRGAVARREINREDLRLSLRDPEAVATLASSLDAESPREVSYALAMLQSVPASELPPQVPALLSHAAPEVRQRAMELVLEAGLDGLEEPAALLLTDEIAKTARLAAKYLDRQDCRAALNRALAGGGAGCAAVLDYLSRETGESERLLQVAAAAPWRDLLKASGVADLREQIAAAAFQGRTWDDDLVALLAVVEPLPVSVQGAAVVGLGRQSQRRHLSGLGALLERRELRPWARRALAAYGPVALPTLMGVLTNELRSIPARAAAYSLLSRLPFQRTVDLICSRLSEAGKDDENLRKLLVPLLVRLRERNAALRFPWRKVEALLRREVASTRHLLATAARLGPVVDEQRERLLRQRLAELRHDRGERVMQMLALQYDVRDIMGAWLRLQETEGRRRADAQEFLESLISPHHKMLIRDTFRAEVVAHTHDRETALLDLMAGDDRWLRICAVWAAAPSPGTALHAAISQLIDSERPDVAEAARAALDLDRRTGTMLSTIEKAILLERVDHFDSVNGDHLAAIAVIAEERNHAAGEAIFRAGDRGDAMFLLVDGEVALQRGDVEIARARPGETFGSWALFEAEPRMVTAVAEGDCRVLRIDRADFTDLMAEDIVVAQSMLRSVARRLRNLAARAV